MKASKSYRLAVIKFLVEASCLKLFLFANIAGLLLILIFYLLGILNGLTVTAVAVVFSGIPFHFLITGYCESWKEERRKEDGKHTRD